MLHWLRHLSTRLTRPAAREMPRRKRPPRFRPAVELLEDRSVPAGFFVTINGVDLLPMVLADASLPGIADRVAAVLPQVSFSLAVQSDTSPFGDLRTSLNSIALTGFTGPGFGVQLLSTGASTFADGTGHFTLDSVPLAGGRNNLTIQVTSPAGYTGRDDVTITRNLAPTLNRALQTVMAQSDDPDTILNIDSVFRDADADLTNSILRFDTIRGVFDVQLFDTEAPRTVTHFLQHVNDGDYRDAIFHRREPNSPPVLQGGQFRFVENPSNLVEIGPGPTVNDEVGRDNTRGTISLAKTGAANSATTQFFFNLVDNTSVLSPDAQTNGGFTVFGEVIGNGLQVVDNLATIPPTMVGTGSLSFTQIPLVNYNNQGQFPTDTVRGNFALINDVVLRQRRDGMTFMATSSRPDVVQATVSGSALTLDYQPGQVGTAVITIQATDSDGASTQTVFSVSVEGPG